MRVETREIKNIVILDLFGPFPATDSESIAIKSIFREALAGREKFIIVLRLDLIPDDIPVFLGMLVVWLENAGVKLGGMGLGPYLHIVSSNSRILSIGKVMDSRAKCFQKEEEAIAALTKMGGGCLGKLVWPQ